MQRKTLGTYLRILFTPFFAWWWAAITGTASILGFLWATDKGVTLTKLQFSGLLFVGTGLVFMSVSAIVQTWSIFSAEPPAISIESFTKSDEPEEEFCILLSGQCAFPTGTLLEVVRKVGDREAMLALVELTERTAAGLHQARSIWLAPVHKADLTDGKIAESEMIVRTFVRGDKIRTAVEDNSFTNHG
jgi:hypothetical protein